MTTWGYNNADQVTSLAQPAGTITYDYDDNARLWKMHQPGSLTTTYTYDFAWRLKTITNGFGEQTSFDYDDASRVIKKTFANGTYETCSYDPRSRVEWIRLFNAGGELSSHHYTYDPASNVKTRTDNGTTTTFGYDDIGQLISESRTGYSATYSYDNNGNRLTRTLDTGGGPTTEVYAYDDADKLLNVKVNGNVVKSFSYDLAGRTTGITDAGGTTTLSYDYEDRLVSISRPGMTTNTFAYNGFGARVSKSDSSGSNTYLRASSGLIGSIVADSGATYTPGVSEKRGTTSTYYHADIKNSVEQTSTGQGVAASKQYDAFGNEVSSSGSWQGPFQYGGAFGYHTDSDYGLKHLGARYYDSTTGRFLSRDPIGDGRNWYAYARGNPTRFGDPTGLFAAAAAAAGGGTLVLMPALVVGGALLLAAWLIWYALLKDQIEHLDFEVWTAPARPTPNPAPLGDPVVPAPPDDERRRQDEWQDVYRLYGGDSPKWGRFWTSEDPRNDPDFRSHYGIGGWNTGEWIVKGRVRKSEKGVTWHPENAKDPKGNDLGNGRKQIWIPYPRSTVRNPQVIPNPPGFHRPSPWD
ncbi:MAG: RHS repeat-associated core domain-containing protein [Armatimonadota bacterium]